MSMVCSGNGRENLPPGCREPEELDERYIPDPSCAYCKEYDNGKGICMKEWNNLDPCYYVDWRDDREPEESCEDYDWCGELLEYPKKPQKADYHGNDKAYMKAVLDWRIEMNKIKLEEIGL